MPNPTNLESVVALMNAVAVYCENLDQNKLIMLNAANLCDQAMGSDAISQKHIQALYDALEVLDRTAVIAMEVFEKLKADYDQAMKILEG